jgi:hypothetical protein
LFAGVSLTHLALLLPCPVFCLLRPAAAACPCWYPVIFCCLPCLHMPSSHAHPHPRPWSTGGGGGGGRGRGGGRFMSSKPAYAGMPPPQADRDRGPPGGGRGRGPPWREGGGPAPQQMQQLGPPSQDFEMRRCVLDAGLGVRPAAAAVTTQVRQRRQ